MSEPYCKNVAMKTTKVSRGEQDFDPVREQAARLRALRGLTGYSAEVIGAEVWPGKPSTNVSSYLSNYEGGKRAISDRFCNALGEALSQSHLLTDDSEYIASYLKLEHSDLRGCITAPPRLSLTPRKLEVVVDNPAKRVRRVSRRVGEQIHYFAHTPSDQPRRVA